MAEPQPTLDQTVARTQQARGKPTFDVYRVLGADEVKLLADPPDESPIQEGDTVLVLVRKAEQAASAEQACWKIAEGPLADDALSDSPPVLTAGNSRNGGLIDPKPYALERAVQRKRK
jgi:hypothetical protein